MDAYFKTNCSLWNAWTLINEKSEFYDIEGFKAGETSLNAIELEELGNVSGKSLLHLQCHFGLDTLSWARAGAIVTGVDFSDTAIESARSLSEETGLDARFICSNIYDLPDALTFAFDIVFTSYGVLSWLPDLGRWAEIVARCLKPGGTFYIVEFHPILYMLDEEQGERLKYPYFHSEEPLLIEEKGSYADPEADFSHVSYFWAHSLSDVINSLISAGLPIEFIHEFPYSAYKCLPFLEKDAEGLWRMKGRRDSVPLMFSIKAVKASH